MLLHLPPFGNMPKLFGMLPTLPILTLPGPDQTHAKRLYPKLAQKISFFSFLTLDL